MQPVTFNVGLNDIMGQFDLMDRFDGIHVVPRADLLPHTCGDGLCECCPVEYDGSLNGTVLFLDQRNEAYGGYLGDDDTHRGSVVVSVANYDDDTDEPVIEHNEIKNLPDFTDIDVYCSDTEINFCLLLGRLVYDSPQNIHKKKVFVHPPYDMRHIANILKIFIQMELSSKVSVYQRCVNMMKYTKKVLNELVQTGDLRLVVAKDCLMRLEQVIQNTYRTN